MEFNIPWQGYRTPQFGESLDGRTTFTHGELGTLVLSGFSLLGMPETYHIGGDRGGTTAGPSKGTGDPDQYPPLPFGPEAFDKLDKESKKKEVELAGANYDMYNWILKTYGMPAAEWYLKTGKTQGNPFLPQGIYVPKAVKPKNTSNSMVAHFVPRGKNLSEVMLVKKTKLQRPKQFFKEPNQFFNVNDIKPEFPENPPPKLDPNTGMHPEYGKKAKRYGKLDPISANSMPPTGDPEIDAVVNKQKTINKIKKMARNK